MRAATIILRRPNGVEYSRETHASYTVASLSHRIGEMVGEVRNDRGWTPDVQIIETDRTVTPPVERDVTDRWGIPR